MVAESYLLTTNDKVAAANGGSEKCPMHLHRKALSPAREAERVTWLHTAVRG